GGFCGRGQRPRFRTRPRPNSWPRTVRAMPDSNRWGAWDSSKQSLLRRRPLPVGREVAFFALLSALKAGIGSKFDVSEDEFHAIATAKKPAVVRTGCGHNIFRSNGGRSYERITKRSETFSRGQSGL